MEEYDSLLEEAAQMVVKKQEVSTSLIQKKFSIGSNRSNRIISQLEEIGIIGPGDETSHREINLIEFNSLAEYEKLKVSIDDFTKYYGSEDYQLAITIFEKKLKVSYNSRLGYNYVSALFQNGGTENKAYEVIIKVINENATNKRWFDLAGSISKWLGDTEEDIGLLNEAISFYVKSDNKEGITEVNERIAEINQYQRFESQQQQANNRREDEKRAISDAEEERERIYENERRDKEEEGNVKVGSYSFKSSITRGGDAIFPEHIYVDDKEVSWEKKTGIFSKDSKTIPMKNITQIDLETSLIGAKIKIRSNGFGFIVGENFTKSDVKQIKSLIDNARSNLKS